MVTFWMGGLKDGYMDEVSSVVFLYIVLLLG